MSTKVKNLVAPKYGKLTVLQDTRNRNNSSSLVGECDCENICVVGASSLRKGTNSCDRYKCNTIKSEHLFVEKITLVVQTLKSFRGY
jgi:hypothetical protein